MDLVGLIGTTEVDFPKRGQRGVIRKGTKLCGQCCVFRSKVQPGNVGLADLRRAGVNLIGRFKAGEGRFASGRRSKLN